jgi:hypothetical protein
MVSHAPALALHSPIRSPPPRRLVRTSSAPPRFPHGRYAPLATPGGLTTLVKAEAITDEERSLLLETTTGTVGRGIMGHAAVLGWLAVLMERGIRDGTLGGSSGRSSISLQHSFQGKLMDLRAAYGSIADELSGRMPLAYAQLVQILCDMLVLFSPVALMGSVGGLGAVIGTGCMTLFYSSVRRRLPHATALLELLCEGSLAAHLARVTPAAHHPHIPFRSLPLMASPAAPTQVLKLAKMFLDPLDNEAYGGKYGISINVGTLLHETNIASERWSRGAARVPKGVLNLRKDIAVKAQPVEAVVDDEDDAPPWQHAERARAAAGAVERQELKVAQAEESDKRCGSWADEGKEDEEQEALQVAVRSADR